jgi:hypothetical protein
MYTMTTAHPVGRTFRRLGAGYCTRHDTLTAPGRWDLGLEIWVMNCECEARLQYRDKLAVVLLQQSNIPFYSYNASNTHRPDTLELLSRLSQFSELYIYGCTDMPT